ncbi:MAG: regulatory protein RecX [Sediminibacterium sp.]
MKTSLTPEQAFQKIKQYCAYQERSHQATKEKLFSMGLYKKDVEILLSQLIEENYLNEQRYALQFVGGHFRIKKWGKIKIAAALKQQKVSSYNIQKALDEIDQTAYLSCLQRLASVKWNALKKETVLNKKIKTTSYLLQKGYESNLIRTVLEKLQAPNET